jgi:hypothetical protein
VSITHKALWLRLCTKWVGVTKGRVLSVRKFVVGMAEGEIDKKHSWYG